MALLAAKLPCTLVASTANLSSAGHVSSHRPSFGLVAPSRARVVAQSNDVATRAVSGVVFEPFVEVQSQLSNVPATTTACDTSFARQRYSAASEAGVNEQINIEYNMSYVYHAMYSYFGRDNVGLPGFAAFFKASSDEEREHAEAFMQYQNKRGGRVKLHSILAPSTTEFDHEDKGDALYAMEMALSFEKLVNEKLHALKATAEREHDFQLSDYVDDFLAEQVNALYRISNYVAQLRRVGKGHGVFHFDLQLAEDAKNGAH